MRSTSASPSRAWSAAVGIAVVAAITELLPVVFGTGEAILDWSFAYVTLRFVLLPAISLLFIACTAIGLIGMKTQRDRLLSASAIVLPASYLALLWIHPLFLFV